MAGRRGRQYGQVLGPLTLSFCLFVAPCTAQAPNDAMPLVTAIQAYVDCKFGEDQTSNKIEGAGILIGGRGDSLFLVTALHVVKPEDPNCRSSDIQVILSDPFAYFKAHLIARDEKGDIALLAASPDSLGRLLRGKRWVRRGPEPRGSVFLIGCPVGGECWEDPLEGRLRNRFAGEDSSLWSVQSPLVEDGYSGGPAVSRSGEIIGMTLDYSGQNARVRRWFWIEQWLKSRGYEVTFPTLDLTPAGWLSSKEPGYRRASIGVTIVGLPLPARAPSGSRLAPSFGIRLESGSGDEGSGYLSLEHLSVTINDTCLECSDRRELEGTAGFFVGLGLVVYPRLISRSKTFQTLHPTFTAGLLFGLSEQLVLRDAPGPVDPATGLPIREHFSTGLGSSAGFELGAGLDAPVGGAFRMRMATRYVILGGLRPFGGATADKLMITAGLLWSLH